MADEFQHLKFRHISHKDTSGFKRSCHIALTAQDSRRAHNKQRGPGEGSGLRPLSGHEHTNRRTANATSPFALARDDNSTHESMLRFVRDRNTQSALPSREQPKTPTPLPEGTACCRGPKRRLARPLRRALWACSEPISTLKRGTAKSTARYSKPALQTLPAMVSMRRWLARMLPEAEAEQAAVVESCQQKGRTGR